MTRSATTTGLLIAVVAAFSFGMSGAFVKPLLDAGWSPAAAVAARSLIGGEALAPIAAVMLRGRWSSLWRGRYRVLLVGLIGVAATQLAYFAALQRIPVGTAILIEYMAPILLIAVGWAVSRRAPHTLVLVGSAAAIVGLVLVVAPGGDAGLDGLGLLLAGAAMVGCAIYYVVVAAPSDGPPPVALAAAGLIVGAMATGFAGLVGLVPLTATFGSVVLLGGLLPWWLPLLIIGVIATAVAYTANITATVLLGARLASFAGLLEVIAASLYAWLLLGEKLSWPQLLGGALILCGIAVIRTIPETADGATVDDGPAVPQPLTEVLTELPEAVHSTS